MISVLEIKEQYKDIYQTDENLKNLMQNVSYMLFRHLYNKNCDVRIPFRLELERRLQQPTPFTFLPFNEQSQLCVKLQPIMSKNKLQDPYKANRCQSCDLYMLQAAQCDNGCICCLNCMQKRENFCPKCQKQVKNYKVRMDICEPIRQLQFKCPCSKCTDVLSYTEALKVASNCQNLIRENPLQMLQIVQQQLQKLTESNQFCYKKLADKNDVSVQEDDIDLLKKTASFKSLEQMATTKEEESNVQDLKLEIEKLKNQLKETQSLSASQNMNQPQKVVGKSSEAGNEQLGLQLEEAKIKYDQLSTKHQDKLGEIYLLKLQIENQLKELQVCKNKLQSKELEQSTSQNRMKELQGQAEKAIRDYKSLQETLEDTKESLRNIERQNEDLKAQQQSLLNRQKELVEEKKQQQMAKQIDQNNVALEAELDTIKNQSQQQQTQIMQQQSILERREVEVQKLKQQLKDLQRGYDNETILKSQNEQKILELNETIQGQQQIQANIESQLKDSIKRNYEIVQELTQNKSQSEVQSQTIQQQYNDLKMQFEIKQTELQQKTAESQNAYAQVQKLSLELQNAKQENTLLNHNSDSTVLQMKQQIFDMETSQAQELNKLKFQIKGLENDLNQQKIMVKQLKDQIADLDKSYNVKEQQLKAQIEQLRNKEQLLTDQIRELNEQILQLAQESSEKQGQIQAKVDELNQLRSASQQQIQKFQLQIESQQQQARVINQQLQLKIDEMQTVSEQKQQQQQQLNTQNQNTLDLTKQLAQAKQEITQMQMQIEQLTYDNTHQAEQIQKQEAQIEQQVVIIDKNSLNIDNLNKIIQSQKNDLYKTQKELERTQQKLSSIQEQTSQLEQDSIPKLKARISDLENQIELQNIELEKRSVQINEGIEDLQSTQEQLNRVTVQASNLEKQNQEKAKKIETIDDNLQKTKKQLADKQNEIFNFTSQKQNQDRQVEKQSQDQQYKIEQLRKDKQNNEEQIASLNQKLDKSSIQCNKYQEQLRNTQKILKSVTQDLKKLKQLKQQELQDFANSTQDVIESLTERCHDMQTKQDMYVNQMNESGHQQKLTGQEQQQKLQSLLQNQEVTIKQLQIKIKQLENDNMALQQKIFELNITSNQYLESTKSLEFELLSTNQQLTDMKQNNEQLQQSIKDKIYEINQIKGEAQMNQQLLKKQTKISEDGQESIQQLHQQVTKLTEQNNQYNMQVNEQLAQLNEVERSSQQVQQQLNQQLDNQAAQIEHLNQEKLIIKESGEKIKLSFKQQNEDLQQHYEKEIESYNNKLKQQQKENQQLSDQILEYKKIQAEVNSRISDIELQSEVQVKKKDHEIKELSDKYKDVVSENDINANLVKQQTQQIKQLTILCEDQNQKIKELTSELDKIQHSSSDQQQQIQQIQKEIASKDEILKKVEKQLDDTNLVLLKKETEQDQILKQQERQVQILQRNNQDADIKLQKLQIELKENREHSEQQRLEIQAQFHKQALERDSEIQAMQQQLDTLQIDNDSLKDELNMTTNDIQHLESIKSQLSDKLDASMKLQSDQSRELKISQQQFTELNQLYARKQNQNLKLTDENAKLAVQFTQMKEELEKQHNETKKLLNITSLMDLDQVDLHNEFLVKLLRNLMQEKQFQHLNKIYQLREENTNLLQQMQQMKDAEKTSKNQKEIFRVQKIPTVNAQLIIQREQEIIELKTQLEIERKKVEVYMNKAKVMRFGSPQRIQ
ncbi:Hypothetical_protein [Hexamita inflata]|uniref:Hypothetical_protein n=1 Tax=Hexamita inflata TaxID=28002 RepID=A0AA86PJ82_9EUKA|nr:Hypothetical protein HINF_LOCUS27741 [Hexamita inflata]